MLSSRVMRSWQGESRRVEITMLKVVLYRMNDQYIDGRKLDAGFWVSVSCS